MSVETFGKTQYQIVNYPQKYLKSSISFIGILVLSYYLLSSAVYKCWGLVAVHFISYFYIPG